MLLKAKLSHVLASSTVQSTESEECEDVEDRNADSRKQRNRADRLPAGHVPGSSIARPARPAQQCPGSGEGRKAIQNPNRYFHGCRGELLGPIHARGDRALSQL